jgi:hypothetical protein
LDSAFPNLTPQMTMFTSLDWQASRRFFPRQPAANAVPLTKVTLFT